METRAASHAFNTQGPCAVAATTLPIDSGVFFLTKKENWVEEGRGDGGESCGARSRQEACHAQIFYGGVFRARAL